MKKTVSLLWCFLLGAVVLALCVLGVKTCGILVRGLEDDNRFFAAMVTDGGGINDQSFQESAWRGMQDFSAKTGSHVSYVECPQTSDFSINIDKLADEKADIIWGIGFKLADTIDLAAKTNPELHYAIADYSYGDKTADNVTGVVFRAEESSFMVGYIAALTTKTNCVGFVGGIRGLVIDQFEYGYRAGVAYGSKKLGKDIKVKVHYAESFSDSAKGKAIAMKMYDECDIVFHAAGGAGVGVIEAAKETGNFVIGVDMDQSYLAPKNVLTSSIKDVGKAVSLISTKVLNGQKIGRQTFSFGLSEECVGIPKDNPNMKPEVYNAAMKIQDKLASGEISSPGTPELYEAFMKKLPGLKV